MVLWFLDLIENFLKAMNLLSHTKFYEYLQVQEFPGPQKGHRF